jgi:hypothetical protein
VTLGRVFTLLLRGAAAVPILSLVISCGPARADRRAAEVEVCGGRPACLIAQYGWSKGDAERAEAEALVARLNAAADARELDSANAAQRVRAARARDSAARLARAANQAKAAERSAAQAKVRAARQVVFEACLARHGWAEPESKDRPVTGRVHGRLVALPLRVHVDTFLGIEKVCPSPQ